ncbi:MAG: amino acid adenylation domain-containing protein [Methylococcus sp.]
MDDENLNSIMQRMLEVELAAAAGSSCGTAEPCPATSDRTDSEPRPAGKAESPQRFLLEIASITAAVLKIPLDRLDVTANLSRFGVDSIIVTEIMKSISDLLAVPIAPTVFFEARTVEELAGLLWNRYRPAGAANPLRENVQAPPRTHEAARDPAPAREPDPPVAAPEPTRHAESSAADSEVEEWLAAYRFEVRGEPAPADTASVAPRETPRTAFEPVAIIAIEGIFPQSADLAAFERHLRDGDDCITEIPPERWDWRAIDGDPSDGYFTRVRFGGFAPEVDKFDPHFFGISPREAELMDPQHRLFIQATWRLFESAGYAPRSLAGRKIGLFIGINLQDYAHLIDRSGAMEALHLTSLGHMFCPNRISFLLDLHGPSQVIDTACSSSLVALHRAVLSVQYEGCEMAVAGGANLMLTPDMHVMYSKVGMICEDGRCKTFSAAANGYVRGEGIGAVLVKPLARAEADGDPILAVIRGSGENHGGGATSLTAPNPVAQAALIAETYRKAAIDPATVGYIECHGTGTALGDPIEINGLKQAFAALYEDRGLEPPRTPFCGLGSVKSNIGHAETAAGVAGLIKAVLSLHHRHLYPTLHCAEQNPLIDLEGSPFYILKEGRPWPAMSRDGVELPRRAGISSFGAGGSNAHVVIEEYPQAVAGESPDAGPWLILLSARSRGQVSELARALLAAITVPSPEQPPRMQDVAYSLQVGRDAHTSRLALIAESHAELAERLAAWIQTETAGPGLFCGDCHPGRTVAAGRSPAPPAEDRLLALFRSGDWAALAEHWIAGHPIDWAALYAHAPGGAGRPRRVVLPTYPFARRRCWIPEPSGAKPERPAPAASGANLPNPRPHPEPVAPGVYRYTLSGEESFLKDHVIGGQRVLAGAAYLDLVGRAYARHLEAEGTPPPGFLPVNLKNITWSRAYRFGELDRVLEIRFVPRRPAGLSFQISARLSGGDAFDQLLCQGGVDPARSRGMQEPDPAGATLAVVGDAASGFSCVDSAEVYRLFGRMGIDYGPAHQTIQRLYHSRSDGADRSLRVLAELRGSGAGSADDSSGLPPPGLLDGALQACLGFALAADAAFGEPGGSPALPFGLDEFTLLRPLSPAVWAVLRRSGATGPAASRVERFDIELVDGEGAVCVRLSGFSSRRLGPAASESRAGVRAFRPHWRPSAAIAGGDGFPEQRRCFLIFDRGEGFAPGLEAALMKAFPGAESARTPLPTDPPAAYLEAFEQVFWTVGTLLEQPPDPPIRLDLIIPMTGETALLAGLSGFLQSLVRERSQLQGRVLLCDTTLAAPVLVSRILDSRGDPSPVLRIEAQGCFGRVWESLPVPPGGDCPWRDDGVYLISGGSGALAGETAAAILTATRGARVVLFGRSRPDRTLDDRLASLLPDRSRWTYLEADVTRLEAVRALVEQVLASHGRIDGVIHCAGILDDKLIGHKTAVECRAVLAPKVLGAWHLDLATRDLRLDVFILYASAAGALGSGGQTDYAAANAFLDAFAEYRKARVLKGQGSGLTLSIAWPLWAEGGMRVDAITERLMQQTTGVMPLPTELGLATLEGLIRGGHSALVLHGDPARIEGLALAEPKWPERPVARADRNAPPAAASGAQASAGADRGVVIQDLMGRVSALMKYEIGEIEAEGTWDEYGFDSITLTEFANRLNEAYGLDLTPTRFFEYPAIDGFADWLVEAHGEALRRVFPPPVAPEVAKPHPESPAAPLPTAAAPPAAPLPGRETGTDEPIAVIGMTGCFPGAETLDQFWDNLDAGRDCIGEIPLERWDWRALHRAAVLAGDTPPVEKGGFMADIAGFDARFFGISDREALLMDPAQRLLLMHTVHLLEEAGYAPKSLQGSNTAIFVGTASSGYGDRIAKAEARIDEHSSTGTVGSIGPNRISFFLDLHGPSEPIETACSSSLVAIHRGIQAIRAGECDQAIVGGVNLIVSPETQISFTKAGMLAEDGRCKTFSAQANGYARGEGVGLLLLKRLSAAERDGDHIHGLLLGSAENHGGRAKSLTAPNPVAQAQVLIQAHERAGVDPRTIGYIEAHGTGTALGDPIELDGLKTAFRHRYQATGEATVAAVHCGLGSVKTNIGHLELAAGVAGVIKVLLQLRYQRLARTLHCDPVNPLLRFEDSPFHLVRESQPWPVPRDRAGHAAPRRAGVSSFGFGGVNAHVVIEEYLPPASADPAERPELALPPALFVLSARNAAALRQMAGDLIAYLDRHIDPAEQAADSGLAEPLRRVVAAIADIRTLAAEEVAADASLDDLGMDPVHRNLLLQRLSEELPGPIEPSLVLKAGSPREIAAALLAPGHGDTGARPPAVHPDGASSRWLHEIAYTLQVGRDPMDERLGFVADSPTRLRAALLAYSEGRAPDEYGLCLGNRREAARRAGLSAQAAGAQPIPADLLYTGRYTAFLEAWVNGGRFDWARLYGPEGLYPFKPRRLSLPGYPYQLTRYWIEPPGGHATPANGPSGFVLSEDAASTPGNPRFTVSLDGRESFLADHRLGQRPLLPGVAYLELARLAYTRAEASHAEGRGISVRDVVWLRPCYVESPTRVSIAFTPMAEGSYRFAIATHGVEPILHCEGRIAALDPEAHRIPEPVGFDAASSRMVPGEELYGAFQRGGLDYGPSHRCIQQLRTGPGGVLAELCLPDARVAAGAPFYLHPGLLDSALQATLGLAYSGADSGDGSSATAIPFSVDAVHIHAPLPPALRVRISDSPAKPGSRLRKVDLWMTSPEGRLLVAIRGFATRPLTGSPPAPQVPTHWVSEKRATRDKAAVLRQLTELLSKTTRIPLKNIDSLGPIEDFGLNSAIILELTGALEKTYGALPKTLFFEYGSLDELADYLLALDVPNDVEPVLPVPVAEDPGVSAGAATPATGPERVPTAPARPASAGALDIAIIGLSGRYPEAADLEAYWTNLREGRDCISEIPAGYWDWRRYYSSDRDEPGRHTCKWGGFIPDADKFDPLFFKIMPNAAALVDPQERVFLEESWAALEDAGYTPSDFGPADAAERGEVGVYVGVMYGEYQLRARDAQHAGRDITVANFYSSIANRVSYAFNFTGPSFAVDTMCSSALTAIHLACQDLRLGRTGLALAGGVNLNLHPNKYAVLSGGQFISTRGKCESFGAYGDGYVPSEGVGVVVLKRLEDAVRDGDHVYGVIKGSALNHGGKATGYSVPNPKAQSAVIRRALQEAGIDPRHISYIEAHGTGTQLGDPIELVGLAKAYPEWPDPDQPWLIGSCKSNIGHCESAAGIAGLTKVLLQMREAEIVPSLHSTELNPNIPFERIPFRVNRTLTPWPRPRLEGREIPRMAALSSFGAGGSNAHFIVSEHLEAAPAQPVASVPRLFVWSALTASRLEAMIERFASHLERHAGTLADPNRWLRDAAFTLQVGREPMPYRLAVVADSVAGLRSALAGYLRGESSAVRSGRAGPASAATAEALPADSLDTWAARWVEGASLEWHTLYRGEPSPPRRISLPSYPFERTRYWIDTPDPGPGPGPGRAAPRAEALATEPSTRGELVMLAPEWQSAPLAGSVVPARLPDRRLVGFAPLPDLAGIETVVLTSTETGIAEHYTDLARRLFVWVKALLAAKPREPVLVQVLVHALRSAPEAGAKAALLGGLGAILKTAHHENPILRVQFIELDADPAELGPAGLQTLLDNEAGQAAEGDIRYRSGQRQRLVWRPHDPAEVAAPLPWRQSGTYLITGGAGGLGWLFAETIARQVPGVRLILTGRSPHSRTIADKLGRLAEMGARGEYHAVDVTDRSAVDLLIAAVTHGQDGGTIDGALHCAGLIRDAFILKKSEADFSAVLAPKVAGTVNLVAALAPLKPDFIALFSSVSGVGGNPGQADYAAGNAFMDRYAELLAGGGIRTPHSPGLPRLAGTRLVSLDWPLWAAGGMDVDPAVKDLLWQSMGLRPLATELGFTAFHASLAAECARLMVLEGDRHRLLEQFAGQETVPAGRPQAASAPAANGGGAALKARIEAELGQKIAEFLGLPVHRLENEVPLERYGLESVAMLKLTSILETDFGELPKTLLLEYPSISAIAGFLAEYSAAAFREHHPVPATDPLPATVAPPAPAVREESPPVTAPVPPAPARGHIAIIGLAGRFPGAADPEEFWERLSAGADLITEVPPSRWDHEPFFSAQPDEAGKTRCKWGGFLDQVDRFDAGFFRISPAEAQLLDPQERLFLETTWHLLESSGYLGENLDQRTRHRVGVFVGSMSQQYHGFQADPVEEALVLLSSPSSIANRVSYFFDFQGPSLAVDTMCSSTLVALRTACESLRNGDCEIAIAGGVNLNLHPKKFLAMSAARMIASHPDSTSFSAGDGYLPAECVGAVLLKPLERAIVDGDTIHAVIRSTAVNHAGQSSGYRVPSAQAQAELIARNLERSGVAIETIGYVESAANGIALADAIEFQALNRAFRSLTARTGFCRIGAVKSNMGHAEAASGLSQLAKVLLQFRHGALAPTIKADSVNPAIHFEDSPFVLQRQLEPWPRLSVPGPDGRPSELPRRAAISAFGLGGTYAHVVLEEYLEPRPAAAMPEPRGSGPHLLLFSAKTPRQLAEVIGNTAEFLQQHPTADLAALAYTLKVCREYLDFRAACVATDRDDLLAALAAFGNPEGPGEARWLTGNSGEDTREIRNLVAGETGAAILDLLHEQGDLRKLAYYWVKGVRIAWWDRYRHFRPRPLALPGYPFEPVRHWIGETSSPVAVHPPAAPLPPAGPPTAPDIETFLLAAIGRLMGLPPERLFPERSFLEFGIDSFKLTALRREIQAWLGIELPSRTFYTAPTPRDLALDIASLLEQPAAESEEYPLTANQAGLWVIAQCTPGSSAYNVPIALTFREPPDPARLEAACRGLMLDYPELGTMFKLRGGQPVQALNSRRGPDIRRETVGRLEPDAVVGYLAELAGIPFDLEDDSLFRVHLVTAETSTTGPAAYLLLVVHHIIFDGASAILLLHRLNARYHALLTGETLPPLAAEARYRDYVAWEQAFVESPEAQRHKAYWQEVLSGELPRLSLPFDLPESAGAGEEGASLTARLPDALADALVRFGHSRGWSLTTVFLGAFKLLLYRYTQASDQLIGLPTLGRPDPRFNNVIGYFVNLVPVRSALSGELALGDFLDRLQLTLADHLDHAACPLPWLLRELGIHEEARRAEFAKVLFAFQNFQDWWSGEAAAATESPFEALPDIGQRGTHALSLEVFHEAGGYRLVLGYDPRRFSQAFSARMLCHYLQLLQSMSTAPESRLRDLEFLDPAEKQSILAVSAPPARPAALSLLTRWTEQVQRTPEGTAVIFTDDSLSYHALDRKSSALARYLRKDLGLDQGARILLAMGRGLDWVVALLGVLKAGCVFVPCASSNPDERIRLLVEDCAPVCALTDAEGEARCGRLFPPGALLTLRMDEVPWSPEAAEEWGVAEPEDPERDAYILYTSGSTGTPKGVRISRGALSRHTDAISAVYRLTRRDRVLAFSDIAFDAALDQIFPPLLAGATVIVRPEALWSAREFCQQVLTMGLTMVDVPPSYLHEILLGTLRDGEWDSLRSLRMVVTGGEALSTGTVALWRESPLHQKRLINAYGPTETTITSLYYEIGPETPASEIDAAIPIGRPLPGESAWILDGDLNLVPDGVTGQLCIGGHSVAQGYLNQEALTAARFILNPHHPGERLYLTGDLARRRPDGLVDFLGREDDQVKIRGYRVELAEIERTLATCPGVRDAVVLVQKQADAPQLVACLRVQGGLSGEVLDRARHHLAVRLPVYMCPSRFLGVATWPLNQAGKIDRRQLAQMAVEALDADAAPCHEPATAVEKSLAALWTRVLGHSRAGLDQGFYEAGGNSILLVRLCHLIRDELGADIPLAVLARATTLRGQARLIEAVEPPTDPLAPERDDRPAVCLVRAPGAPGDIYGPLRTAVGARAAVHEIEASVFLLRDLGSVEELAGYCLETLRQVQPAGPYRLAGWSLGGLIAYEMAALLIAAGEAVDSLILMDCFPPAALRELDAMILERLHLAADDLEGLALISLARDLGALAPNDTGVEWVLETGTRQRLERLATRISGQEPASALASEELAELLDLYLKRDHAIARYTPTPLGIANAWLIQAEESKRYFDLEERWSEFLGPDLREIVLPGTHFTLLGISHVQSIAAIFTRLLDGVEPAP